MKKFNYFDEIEHKPLRTFNRAAMFYNLTEDFGLTVAKDYVSRLTLKDRKDIIAVLTRIEDHGLDCVRKQATDGLVFEDWSGS